MLVTVWVHATAGWTGVVTTSGWNCGICLVLIASVGTSTGASSSASVAGLMRRTDVVISNSETAGSFGILSVGGMGSLWALTAPEPPVAAAGGVVIGRRWAVTLLATMVTTDPKLHESADEEEECANYGNCKAGSVVMAGSSIGNAE